VDFSCVRCHIIVADFSKPRFAKTPLNVFARISWTEEEMKKNKPLTLLFLHVIAGLLLMACGSNQVVVTETKIAADIPKITSKGYTCPEPEFPLDVTSTELNLFVWTEYIPAEMVECFELVYHVKVNRDEYSTNEGMFDRVVGEGSNYDLVQPTDYIVAPMVRQGLLQELDHAKLPVLKNFNQSYLDFEFDPGNRYTIPYLAGTDAIVVNTGMVETPPQSWADLWKPEYAGRMIFLDDSRTVIGITLLALGYDVNTTDPAQLEEARKKLSELIPNIKLFDSDSPRTALLTGAAELGVTWTGEAYLAQKEHPNIQYVFPTEGVILWQDNWAMLNGALHPDAAYAWLNYINQGNIFWMTIRDWPYTNPNQAALDFARDNKMKVKDEDGSETTLGDVYKAYMESPITNIPAAAMKNGHRIVDVGESAQLYGDIWSKIKGGR
jgi:spermidine/putrescine-binding protein